jgi:AsmA protein
VELRPLILSRTLIVTGLTIDRPQVALLQNAEGTWNYATLGRKTAAPAAETPPAGGAQGEPIDVSAKLVRITDGVFTMGGPGVGRKPVGLRNVNLELRDLAAHAAFPFSFSANVDGGGSIKLDGTAGPFDSADATPTPFSAKLELTGLDLAGSGVAGAAPIAGVVALSGQGNSAGGKLSLSGKLKAEKLKLAKNGTPSRRPVEFDFALAHDLRTHAGALQRGDIHLGAAAASLTGTYQQKGEAMLLSMKFAGPDMPIPELTELLPPLDIRLPEGSSLQGGTASANFAVSGPTDRLSGSGSIGLANTRLAGFDLGSKIAAVQQLAGIKGGKDTDIQTLAADVKTSPGGIAVDNLNFVAPAIGELKGAGTISPANELNFKMSAVLHSSGSQAALALSRVAVAFLVQGSAANPVFKPDVKGMAQQNKQLILEKAPEAVKGLVNRLFGGKDKKP